MLVRVQVVLMLLSIWNICLVIGDPPSFLGSFVMFCVLVRHREQMVWGLSCGIVIYCERRLLPLISLSVMWLVLLHVLSLYCDRTFRNMLVIRMWANLSLLSYSVIILYSCDLYVWRLDVRVCLQQLLIFVKYGPLESLGLLNHFLVFSSLS